MNDKPMISVVMSVYNGERHLRDSIDSVQAQTYGDFEFLIVNDGSTDDSRKILAEYERGDSRVRVIDQENAGLTLALIRGCEEAHGQYIARQDADDWSSPERFPRQVALLQRYPEVGFVSSGVQYIGPCDEPLGVTVRPDDPPLATQRLLNERQGPPAHGSVMFRKSVYQRSGGYRQEFYFGQDSDLWLRMAERAMIAYLPEVLYNYRRDMTAISGAHRVFQKQFGRLGQACRSARREGRSEAPHLEQARLLADHIRNLQRGGTLTKGDGLQMAYLIGSQLAQDGDTRGATYLWHVLRRQPWHWRAWTRLAQLTLRASGKRNCEDA